MLVRLPYLLSESCGRPGVGAREYTRVAHVGSGRRRGPGSGPPALVHARHRAPGHGDRGARQHRAERGHPHDHAGVPHHAAEPAVGDHRLRPHLRHVPDHRWPARRSLRPPAGVHRRRRPVRRRLAARLALVERRQPRGRRSAHRRSRRVAHAAGHPRHPLHHVLGQGTGHRLRAVGRRRRFGGRPRPGARRLAHERLLVALVVPHQRDHRPDRHHRHAPHDPPAGQAARHPRAPRPPGRRPRRARHVPPRVRPQRRRHLRLDHPDPTGHDPRCAALVGNHADLDRPGRLPRVGHRARPVPPGGASTRARRPPTTVRVRSARPPHVPLRPAHHGRAGDGPARPRLRPRPVPAGGQAPHRPAQRAVGPAHGLVDPAHRPHRRPAGPAHRDRPR